MQLWFCWRVVLRWREIGGRAIPGFVIVLHKVGVLRLFNAKTRKAKNQKAPTNTYWFN
jgi:hypothetical protein